MSAGLLGVCSFGGAAELWPLVFYGLKAMANRGDSAEAYVYDGDGLRRVEAGLTREAEKSPPWDASRRTAIAVRSLRGASDAASAAPTWSWAETAC